MSDLAAANKKAFDDFASSYDLESWQINIGKVLTEGLQARKDWLGARWIKDGSDNPVKLLDYAAGTGAASIALKPFVSQIRGMDISPGMISRYNEAMQKLGLSHEQAHGVVTDLTSSESKDVPEANELYDVAIFSLALHHVDDPGNMLKALAARLKPEGVLIVVDFLPFEHKDHHDHHDKHGGARAMAHTIKKHGFTQQDMAALYDAVGLTDFGFEVLPEKIAIGKDGRDMWIARGRKAQ